ncbi:zinc-binding dehydrogenase [Muricoccus aerilatus]|uniref:zinc-binding dehydrogenase n=1 Tax=Muricoccus aerilatus TaxID=452982 RepID=UPI0005C1B39B|nr:zinc-binding dehydrogenase [Roseomonas aerilata]
MRAAVIREVGPPEVLRMEEVPLPVPSPGEVLVQVHAVSVNRTLDLAVRAGTYARPVRFPHVLGTDPSGIVVALGEGVTSRKLGDRVSVMARLRPAVPGRPPVMLGVDVWGGYADYVAVPAEAARPIPDGLDFLQATVVARHAPMAYGLLRDEARVQLGEWVVVMGAAGGLGAAGVQVAKLLGARVIAAAGAPERVQHALELGAEHGVNYRQEDLTARVREITAGRGADVVFENIADPTLFPQAFLSLGRNGRLVTAGAHGGGTVPLDVKHLYLSRITVIGSAVHRAEDVDESLQVAARGAYRVTIDRILPLDAAAEAHRLVADRAGLGKVMLVPGMAR